MTLSLWVIIIIIYMLFEGLLVKWHENKDLGLHKNDLRNKKFIKIKDFEKQD